MDEQQDPIIKGLNPVTAIVGAVVVAASMVLVTFLIFINSTAYATVKQIQIGTKIVQTLNSDIDTKSPIKADDIVQFQKSIEQRTSTMDDSSDFNNSELSDQALGLTNNQ